MIPPDVRSRLKGLRLVSRRARGGQGFGVHRSHSRGAGLEFAQYRAYEPGDEPRQIDWKLYARSDRFFVREAERESPLALWILIDASASMSQADAANPAWTRLQAAKQLAACLGELALQQGDRFGLIGMCDDSRGLGVLVPEGGSRQRSRLWIELQALATGKEFPGVEKLAPVWERIATGDLVVVIGDGFDDGCVAMAERLSAAGREVLFVQVLTTEERDFPFVDGHRFVDPETGEELRGDGAALRAGFLQRFDEAQRALQARLAHAGIRRVTWWLDQPPDLPLRQLFGDRHAAEQS
ncbi:MAG: DUF58 domain-containing protein [Proteobacteria bacterium]|nr:DUF58 domain-containing protein [Pseudomonadota bacterium]